MTKGTGPNLPTSACCACRVTHVSSICQNRLCAVIVGTRPPSVPTDAQDHACMPVSMSVCVSVCHSKGKTKGTSGIQNSAARPTQARHSGTPIPALLTLCRPEPGPPLSLCCRPFSLLTCTPSHLATAAHAQACYTHSCGNSRCAMPRTIARCHLHLAIWSTRNGIWHDAVTALPTINSALRPGHHRELHPAAASRVIIPGGSL